MTSIWQIIYAWFYSKKEYVQKSTLEKVIHMYYNKYILIKELKCPGKTHPPNQYALFD